MLKDNDAPEELLTAEQCQDELASLFATAILRLHSRPYRQPQEPPDSAQNGLDVSAETSVHGHAG
jgi:hypothetical protein